jgi:hypothetical protein
MTNAANMSDRLIVETKKYVIKKVVAKWFTYDL